MYQSLSFCVILRWMPESADSATNGTRICSGNDAGRPASAEVTAKSQMPFRLAQSGRVSCGRGYSGSGLSTETWSVHGVVMGAGFGVHARGAAAAVPEPVRAVPASRASTADSAVSHHRRLNRGRSRGGACTRRIVTPWEVGVGDVRVREAAGPPRSVTGRLEPDAAPGALSGPVPRPEFYISCRRRPSQVWATTTTARNAPLTTCW